MNTAIKTIAAACLVTVALGTSSAAAQSTHNIGPAPAPGFIGAPPSQVAHSCPAGYEMIIRVDYSGNQFITCILPRPERPVPVVGAIIEGVIGGIISGGIIHR